MWMAMFDLQHMRVFSSDMCERVVVSVAMMIIDMIIIDMRWKREGKRR